MTPAHRRRAEERRCEPGVRSTSRAGLPSQRSGIVERSAHETRIAALADRAIALARTFGTRGRVLIPPEDLEPKGDLNQWLGVGAEGDPAAFRSLLEQALATSPTPWTLQIQRLPSDLAPWDLEDHAGVRDLLCEIGHQGPLSRDISLRLLAERCGVALTTLQEAARECAQSADTEL